MKKITIYILSVLLLLSLATAVTTRLGMTNGIFYWWVNTTDSLIYGANISCHNVSGATYDVCAGDGGGVGASGNALSPINLTPFDNSTGKLTVNYSWFLSNPFGYGLSPSGNALSPINTSEFRNDTGVLSMNRSMFNFTLFEQIAVAYNANKTIWDNTTDNVGTFTNGTDINVTNINVTGNITVNNLCNSTACYILSDLLRDTTGSGADYTKIQNATTNNCTGNNRAIGLFINGTVICNATTSGTGGGHTGIGVLYNDTTYMYFNWTLFNATQGNWSGDRSLYYTIEDILANYYTNGDLYTSAEIDSMFYTIESIDINFSLIYGNISLNATRGAFTNISNFTNERTYGSWCWYINGMLNCTLNPPIATLTNGKWCKGYTVEADSYGHAAYQAVECTYDLPSSTTGYPLLNNSDIVNDTGYMHINYSNGLFNFTGWNAVMLSWNANLSRWNNATDNIGSGGYPLLNYTSIRNDTGYISFNDSYRVSNASYAANASYSTYCFYSYNGSFSANASYATNAYFATNSSYARNASWTLNASFATNAYFSWNASYAANAYFATNASYARNASWTLNASFATNSYYSWNTSYASNASWTLNSSYATLSYLAANSTNANMLDGIDSSSFLQNNTDINMSGRLIKNAKNYSTENGGSFNGTCLVFSTGFKIGSGC